MIVIEPKNSAVKKQRMASMGAIAKTAGVSRTAVSYVLNNRNRADGSISDETRSRITEAAEAHGYHLNALAKSMVADRANIIAIITDDYDFENKFRVLSGVLEATYEAGYLAKMIQLPHGRITEDAVNLCLQWRVSAIIAINPAEESMPIMQRVFKTRNIPVAIVDSAARLEWGIDLMSDDAQGIKLALDYLIGLGHRKIGLFNSAPGERFANWREETYRALMENRADGAYSTGIVSAPWIQIGPIRKAALKLLHQEDRPSGVICSSDVFGMVLMREARKAGLRVPEDLSITGYSNFTLSEFADPPLTTIEQPFHEMGRSAVEKLVGACEANSDEPVHEVNIFPNRLILRDSCQQPPSKIRKAKR